MSPNPNLFVAGFPKCGTTSLYSVLSQHDFIQMSSVKEPATLVKDSCFNTNNIMTPSCKKSYLRLFSTLNETVLYYGDATPCAVFPNVPGRIKANFGSSVKIILLLRDPVYRAISHYWHAYRIGVESHSLVDAFIDEDPSDAIDSGTFPKYYLLNGRYHLHISRFVAEFGVDNVHLCSFENLTTSPNVELELIWKFLGLDSIPISLPKENVSHSIRSRFIQSIIANPSKEKELLKSLMPKAMRSKLVSLMTLLNRDSRKRPPQTPESVLEMLARYYQEDNLALASMYGFNTANWLSANAF